MSNKSINFTQYIIDLEEKFSLFNWKSNNVHIWELIRVELFLKIQEKKNRESFGSHQNISSFQKLKMLSNRVFRNFFHGNPLFNLKKKQILVFRNHRRYPIKDDKLVDIYTHFITEKLIENGENVEIYVDNYKSQKLEKDSINIDVFSLTGKTFKILFPIKLTKDDFILLDNIQKKIYNDLQIEIDILQIVKNKYSIFLSESKIYNFLLQLKSPNRIYLVNYSDYPALIDVAKKRNIEVIEMQHGLIIKESLIYHFPFTENNSLNYFPNKYYYWKDFKFNNAKLPLSNDNVVSNVNNHLEYMKILFKEETREEKSILIGSQPFYSENIQEFILQNLPRMKDYNFYYKLHPMEFDNFENSVFAKKLIKFENLKIIKNEESIYKLLMRCSHIVGIYSTSLFEAEMFGCIPLVLNSNSEYNSLLFTKGTARRINMSDNLRSIVTQEV